MTDERILNVAPAAGPTAGDHCALPLSTDGGSEYFIAPGDPQVHGRLVDEVRPHPSSVPSSAPPLGPLVPEPGLRQFTLPMMIALTVAVAIVFAVMRTLPARLAVALLGLALALAGLTGLTRTPLGTMIWWTLLVFRQP